MTRTDIATLHDLLGGALPGRIHLLTGGPGSGKSSACLHFLRTGMLRGERTVLLTLDRPSDLQSHAAHLGHDLRASVRDGRMTLIRYHAGFVARISAAASPAAVVAELTAMFELADLRGMHSRDVPMRIAIDPISPFLADGAPTGPALAALVDWLDETDATALLTWNGDVAAASDRRLERLLERAAVILKFERLGAGIFRAETIRARHAIANTPPIDFEIRPGLGLAAAAPAPATTPLEALGDRPAPSPNILLGSLTPLVRDGFLNESDSGQAPS